MSTTDHVLYQMDNGNLTAVVLLDVTSAFDTVRHSTLLDLLCSFGVSSSAMDWFSSYLTDRHQCVSIGGVKSKKMHLTHGVPQGSVCGPLLFSVYTQPLGELIRSQNVDYHFYADDIQLFISFPPKNENLLSVVSRLEDCVADIKAWMTSNNLKLNGCKSEFMLLGSKGMLSKVTTPSFKTDDVTLEPKESCRNLGVIFDANMTLNNHISHVAKSVRYQLRNLSHIRKFLSRKATEQVVHSLISSRLDFCNSILINLPEYQLKRLQYLQNSAARLVTRSKSTSRSILKELHWLPVHARINFKILLLVHQSLQSRAPTYIQDLWT